MQMMLVAKPLMQNEAVQVVTSLYPHVPRLCNDTFAEIRVPNLNLISILQEN